MPNATALIRALERVARDQQRVIVTLQKLLPTMNGGVRRGLASEPKRLRCPRCDRRFALPMNLGRHLAATHRRKGTKKAA
jgi:hypothetical protein